MKFRQGDVLFCKVKALPEGNQKKRESGVVALGEATGHSHRVCIEQGAEVLEIGEGLFVRVSAEGGVSIEHQEHGAIQLPTGDYSVSIQREYAPEEIRNVAD
jgi:hypothetical protein